MNAQTVALWGVFPNPTAASRVLHRLKAMGFGQSQIAIQKHFQESWLATARSHAIYQRVPEGIVTGFVGGAILGGVGALLLSKGTLELLPIILISAVCSVIGTILGAAAGLIYAGVEPLVRNELSDDEAGIAIGVQCVDVIDEVRAKEIFEEAGGARISTERV